MPLYRVFHHHRTGECSFANTVVADNVPAAISLRDAELGVERDDPFDVSVDEIPDPDGSLERKWLERWAH